MGPNDYGLVACGTNKLRHLISLTSIELNVDVLDSVASTTTVFTYENKRDEAVEAVFMFPMDAQSAVYHFEAEIDGRIIVGECQEKGQAEESYKDAKEAGHTAFLLEEHTTTGDIFRCHVGNLPAATKAVIRFKYVTELPLEEDGSVRCTIPMLLNHRYGDPGVPQRSLHVISYTTTFEAVVRSSRSAIESVQSDKTAIKMEYTADHKRAVKVLLDGDYTHQHDITFFVKYSQPHIPSAVMQPGGNSKDGVLAQRAAMLTFFPSLQSEAPQSKGEFIFVVDRSGSMGGEKMNSAKDALLFFLKSLPTGCYFNVVSFGSSYSSLFPTSQEYSQTSLNEACTLQYSMTANMSGTEIYEPLQYVYSQPYIPGHTRQVFLLTDGQVYDTQKVISLAAKQPSFSRTFAIGIGEGASTALVSGVARAGNGRALFVTGKERLKAKVMRLLKLATQAVASHVKVDWSVPVGLTVTQMPRETPVVFTGERLIVYALLKGEVPEGEHLKAVLTGKVGDSPLDETVSVSLLSPDEASADLPIHRLASKSQIKEVEQNEEDTSSDDLLVLLSTTANIISRKTSFIGVDKASRAPVSVPRQVKSSAAQPPSARYHRSVCIGSCRRTPSPPSDSCQLPSAPLQSGNTTAQKGVYSVIPGASRTRTVRDKMTMLVDLQQFDGSWKLGEKFSVTTTMSMVVLVDKCPCKDMTVWATIIALTILVDEFASRREEWEMLKDKAERWLGQQGLDGNRISELKEKAKKMMSEAAA